MSLKTPAPAMHNPFQPGSGVEPPHLAGRDLDVKTFRECLEKARDGRSPGPIALLAPRGQGKTALMNRMAAEAVKLGAVRLRLSPASVPASGDLLDALSSAAHGGGVPVRRNESWEGGMGVPGVAKGGASRTVVSEIRHSFAEACARASSGAPLLIMVDEAHTLSVETGRLLIQCEQDARGEGAKTQLVIAGTPDLHAHVGKMRVTFWDRLGNRLRQLQLLNERDAIDVIEKPLQRLRGVRLAPETHQEVMDWTSGYPYFLQLLGEALWEVAPMKAQTITKDDLREAERPFKSGKNAYYNQRFDELVKDGLLGAALATAIVQRAPNQKPMSRLRLDEACRCGAKLSLGADADAPTRTGVEIGELLQHRGFVWRADPAKDELIPGIPSLIDHVHERVLADFPDAEAKLLKDARFRRICPQSQSRTPPTT